MKCFVTWVGLVVFCGPCPATEKRLDGATLSNLLNDITLTSTETGREVEQVFRASGLTFTVDIESHAQAMGFWRIEGDKYCSQWPPSAYWSCYDVFGNEDGVVFVSSNGTRYQMETPPAD